MRWGPFFLGGVSPVVGDARENDVDSHLPLPSLLAWFGFGGLSYTLTPRRLSRMVPLIILWRLLLVTPAVTDSDISHAWVLEVTFLWFTSCEGKLWLISWLRSQSMNAAGGIPFANFLVKVCWFCFGGAGRWMVNFGAVWPILIEIFFFCGRGAS